MKISNIEGCVPGHFISSAHVYRQIFATVAASLPSLSGGMNTGHTAVLIAQLQNDTTFPYDNKFDSWIASFAPLAMAIGSLFAGSINDWIGRKMSQVLLSIPFIIGWIIMGLSTNNTMILIARFIIGISFGASRSSSMVFMAELAEPKNRAILLVFPSISIHLGNLISHSVGKYVYWRYSCYLFAIPLVISLIIFIFLKESPLWLLEKGRIDEGIESFKLYRGNTESSERELTLVLQECKNKASFSEIINVIFSKPFIKTLLSTCLLFVAAHWCGVNTVPYYAEYLFQKTFTGDIDAFLLMIASDCIRVIANSAVCIVTKFLPQRLTFLVSCYITGLMLTAIAVYLYFVPTRLLWIALTFFIIYFITGSVTTSISYSIVPEIFPAKLRGFGSGLGAAIAFLLLFISVKVTPGILSSFGDIALYANYAFFTLVSGTCLIFLLPDTNGRTLQAIENSLYKKQQHDEINSVSVATPNPNQNNVI